MTDLRGAASVVLSDLLVLLDNPPHHPIVGVHEHIEDLQRILRESAEVKPHRYSPDAMAMGDCKTCGNVDDAPVHAIFEMADDYGRLTVVQFNAKWGEDWYSKHGKELAEEFVRRGSPKGVS